MIRVTGVGVGARSWVEMGWWHMDGCGGLKAVCGWVRSMESHSGDRVGAKE